MFNHRKVLEVVQQQFLTLMLLVVLLVLLSGCVYTSTTMYVKDEKTGENKEIFSVTQWRPGKCSYSVEKDGKKVTYEVDSRTDENLILGGMKHAVGAIAP